MPAMTIRNIPEATHRAIKARAAAHGRSAEAEVRAILEETVLPSERLKLGTYIHSVFAEIGGVELDITRDKTPYEAIDFTDDDYS